MLRYKLTDIILYIICAGYQCNSISIASHLLPPALTLLIMILQSNANKNIYLNCNLLFCLPRIFIRNQLTHTSSYQCNRISIASHLLQPALTLLIMVPQSNANKNIQNMRYPVVQFFSFTTKQIKNNEIIIK